MGTLAQTIQGEAGGSGYLDMLGVANVINNRALSNYGGYGTDPLVQANASGQFLGTNYSGAPSATAQTLANQVASGTLPNDPTGGALYFKGATTDGSTAQTMSGGLDPYRPPWQKAETRAPCGINAPRSITLR
jgi:spore germination cell wall hydrolase CwlJ-like protein